MGSPNWSTPAALNCALPPGSTLVEAGETAMVVSTGGAGAGSVETVTFAVPDTLPSVAVTVKGPPSVAPAVNSPAWSMVPPLTLQVGVVAMGLPNWSRPTPLN